MTQWRWRYALWYLLALPAIWPLAAFASWAAENFSHSATPPDFPFEVDLLLGALVVVPLVIGLYISEVRAARRFAAIRAQFPRAVIMEFGVSKELRASLQQALGRRLAGLVVASMVVVISETAIGLHRRADPTRPELVLRWGSIGRVAVVRKRRTLALVVEILRPNDATGESLILDLPMPLLHSPSLRAYESQRPVLESALDGVESWREHRFVARVASESGESSETSEATP